MIKHNELRLMTNFQDELENIKQSFLPLTACPNLTKLNKGLPISVAITTG